MPALRSKRSYAERHHGSRYFNELPVEPLSQPNFGVRRAFASDVLFAERIVEENTAKYYTRRGEKWTASRFLSNYEGHENFILFLNGERAGVMQLRGKADAFWICSLEVTRAASTKGLPMAAVGHALTVARRLGYSVVKAKIFSESPAIDLYKQLGFSTVGTNGDMIWLERSTSVF
jgi:GNAT superfamily N-acetyltransferase